MEYNQTDFGIYPTKYHSILRMNCDARPDLCALLRQKLRDAATTFLPPNASSTPPLSSIPSTFVTSPHPPTPLSTTEDHSGSPIVTIIVTFFVPTIIIVVFWFLGV